MLTFKRDVKDIIRPNKLGVVGADVHAVFRVQPSALCLFLAIKLLARLLNDVLSGEAYFVPLDLTLCFAFINASVDADCQLKLIHVRFFPASSSRHVTPPSTPLLPISSSPSHTESASCLT